MNTSKWIGIPYKPRGTPPSGADCWTLAKAFAKSELGETWPEYMYDCGNHLEEGAILIRHELSSLGDRWKQVHEFEVGTFMLFRMRARPLHCGIYLGAGEMLHTLEGKGSCIERMDLWQHRILGAYKWIGN